MNQHTEQKNNYVANSLWMLLEKVLRIISGILVGVLVARYLGPAKFGTISYALNVIAIFTIFSTLGLDSLVVRELLTRPKQCHAILGTAFWLRFMGGIGVVLLACSYSYIKDWHNAPERTVVVAIISISIVLQSLTVIDFYFQSKTQGRFAAMNQVFTLAISAFVKIILIVVKAHLYWFAAMAILEALLTALFQLYFYKKNGNLIGQWRFTIAESKALLLNAWPIIISAFVQIVYQKADQILILRFLQNMDFVGQYAAAVRISEASFFVPVAICAAVFPGIINNRSNPELQLKRFTQLCSLLIWGALFLSLGGLVFGDWVIHALFKENFYLTPGVFKIHIWSTIPIFYGTAWGMWMLAHNRQKIIIIFQVINLLIYIIASFTLIPKYGVNGAAYTALVTYFGSLSCITLFYRTKESVYIFTQALNPLNVIEVIKYIKQSKTR